MQRIVPLEMAKRQLTLRLSLSALLLAVAFGCSNHTPAPVYDLQGNPHQVTTAERPSKNFKSVHTYKVKPGDTLYSIAWQFGLDYKRLAALNSLHNYRIYPGQKLRLKGSSKNTEALFDYQSLRYAIFTEVLNRIPDDKTIAGTSQNHQRRVASASASSSRKSQARVRVRAAKQTQRAQHRVANRTAKSSASKAGRISRWIWPVQGPVLAGFSQRGNANKGIDIGGSRGTAVRAAAPGRVVYSGNGLRGYGNLVIIKHNDEFLSAYAHNSRLHVEENEIVKAGQRIAEVGSTGTKENKLHFEIRYRGRPVDPLNYLPELK